MPRRPERPELAAAREQLRSRYEKQQAAVAAFFDAAARLAKLRDEVAAVEAGLRSHAATLADALGVDTAAQVTGWSRGQLAEAQRQRRARRSATVTLEPRPRGGAAGDEGVVTAVAPRSPAPEGTGPPPDRPVIRASVARTYHAEEKQ